MHIAGTLARKTVIVALMVAFSAALAISAAASPLPETIEKIRPSVVGIGIYSPTQSPRVDFRGTGFVIADGKAVLTNSHVVTDMLDQEQRQRHVVLTGKPGDPQLRDAKLVGRMRDKDLALLSFEGKPLPALKLGNPKQLKIGSDVAYTGFPIGMIIGFYPVTHKAIISARTPLTLPARRSDELDANRISRLRRAETPMVFQLDGTAYPGNSGSPVYDIASGEVYAVLNKVFVQGGREAAVEQPSGISYAIPIDLARPLLDEYRPKP